MFVKLPRDFPGPQTPTAALSGISMSTKTPLRDLTAFQMPLSEVLEDLMDPDKAGDGVKGLKEPLRSFT